MSSGVYMGGRRGGEREGEKEGRKKGRWGGNTIEVDLNMTSHVHVLVAKKLW